MRCTRCEAILTVQPIKMPSPILREPRPIEVSSAEVHPAAATQRTRVMSSTFIALMGVALVIALVSLAVWRIGTPRQNPGSSVLPSKTPVSAENAVPLCAQGQPVEHLTHGQKIEESERENGKSTLLVKNGTGHDAAVRLVDSLTGRTIRFVYVRAGNAYKVSGIEPGSYRLDFMTGSDWVSACRGFIRDPSYSEFEGNLVFKFSSTENENEVTTWTTHGEVTLNPVVGGNAKIRQIDRKRFFEGDQYVGVAP